MNSDSNLLVAIEREKIAWESLGFADARKGSEPRPLTGIDTHWQTAYLKGYQEGLKPDQTEEIIPF